MNRLLFLMVLLLPWVARAANPSFNQFNTNHFGTNGYIVSSLLTNANTLHVMKNGNNATAQVGSQHRPWADPFAAKAFMTPDRTMLIWPGTYNTNNILTNGTYIGLGAKLTYTDPGSGPGYGIFDTRTCGGVTSVISGDLKIEYSTGVGYYNLNALGAIVSQNTNVDLTIDIDSIRGYSDSTNANGAALIYVTEANNVAVKANLIASTQTNGSCIMYGVYWEHGNMQVNCPIIRTDSGTAIWGNGLAAGIARVAEMDVTSDLVEGVAGLPIYVSGFSNAVNYKLWANIKEIRKRTGSDPAILLQGGARFYLVGNSKISGGNSVIELAGDGLMQAWIDSQKISVGNAAVGVLMNGAQIEAHVAVHDWQDLGTAAAMVENQAGRLELIGGYMHLNTGQGVRHLPAVTGTTRLRDVFIHSTNNVPVRVALAGLTINGGELVGKTNSVYATSAQTVRMNSPTINTNPHANVTVIGTYVFDGTIAP